MLFIPKKILTRKDKELILIEKQLKENLVFPSSLNLCNYNISSLGNVKAILGNLSLPMIEYIELKNLELILGKLIINQSTRKIDLQSLKYVGKGVSIPPYPELLNIFFKIPCFSNFLIDKQVLNVDLYTSRSYVIKRTKNNIYYNPRYIFIHNIQNIDKKELYNQLEVSCWFTKSVNRYIISHVLKLTTKQLQFLIENKSIFNGDYLKYYQKETNINHIISCDLKMFEFVGIENLKISKDLLINLT